MLRHGSTGLSRRHAAAALVAIAFWSTLTAELDAQKTASTVEPPRTVDPSYHFDVSRPAYPEGTGPAVCIDEAHHNFHTATGTYRPFAELLRQDGYMISRFATVITPQTLATCEILVIADAQPPPEPGDPPTFSQDEIHTLNEWVRRGGSLFLITDHMPDPAAVSGLAGSFDIEVNNGYVLSNSQSRRQPPIVFTRDNGTLVDSPITMGRSAAERVQIVATFTGAAFRVSSNEVLPILTFGPGRRSWMPKEYWKFPPGTPTIDVSGWLQGAARAYGAGRLAFFGEAAMFSAQILDRGRTRFGMNHPTARDNARLLLNVMHWLSGLL